MKLAAIYRHPIKSLGEEALEAVELTAGSAMPFDRRWALSHGRSAFDPAAPEWVPPRSHVIQSQSAELARIACRLDESTGVIHLSHPISGEVTAAPDDDDDALSDWIAPLAGPAAPPPYRLVSAPGQAMTDFPDTHLSIGNLASLRALEEMAGRKLAHIRFRMNLWIDGSAPWEELDWLDAAVAVGAAKLKIIDRVKRCAATNADPETGTRTTDIPRLLHGRFGHMDFGVYAQVTAGGRVAVGDPVSA